MGMSIGGALGLLTVASLGCAKPRLIRAPQATAAWRELSTDHFAVATDLPDGEAEHVARELEEYLAALIETAVRGAEVPTLRIPVIAFASGTELHEYLQSVYAGIYVTGILDRPVIVAGGDAEAKAFYDGGARHELAHYVTDLSFHHPLPRWFAEGTANYLETIAADRDNQVIVVGRASYSRVVALRTHGLLPVRELLGPELDSRDKILVERYYATSWLLIHYLLSSHAEAFGAYQDRLRAGVDPDQAWAQSFSRDVQQHLDAALADHLASKRYEAAWRRPWRAPTVDVRTRTLAPAEILVIRALVYVVAGLGGDPPPPGWRAHASELAAEVLRSEPTNPRALRIRELAERTSEGGPR
jgi:hypothetical protein